MGKVFPVLLLMTDSLMIFTGPSVADMDVAIHTLAEAADKKQLFTEEFLSHRKGAWSYGIDYST